MVSELRSYSWPIGGRLAPWHNELTSNQLASFAPVALWAKLCCCCCCFNVFHPHLSRLHFHLSWKHYAWPRFTPLRPVCSVWFHYLLRCFLLYTLLYHILWISVFHWALVDICDCLSGCVRHRRRPTPSYVRLSSFPLLPASFFLLDIEMTANWYWPVMFPAGWVCYPEIWGSCVPSFAGCVRDLLVKAKEPRSSCASLYFTASPVVFLLNISVSWRLWNICIVITVVSIKDRKFCQLFPFPHHPAAIVCTRYAATVLGNLIDIISAQHCLSHGRLGTISFQCSHNLVWILVRRRSLTYSASYISGEPWQEQEIVLWSHSLSIDDAGALHFHELSLADTAVSSNWRRELPVAGSAALLLKEDGKGRTDLRLEFLPDV